MTSEAQLSLLLEEFRTRKINPGEGETIEERFRSFHAQNPHVYRAIVALARRAKHAGCKHIGIKLIFERLRWESVLRSQDAQGFKLNNDYTSRYSRLVDDQEPDLRGFFRFRRRRAA